MYRPQTSSSYDESNGKKEKVQINWTPSFSHYLVLNVVFVLI
jgi:hypothetical protein